jgi:lipoprotein signal peptidase
MTRPRRPRSWILLGGVAGLVVIIDQGTKLLARRTLAVHQFVPLLDSWLGLRRIYARPPTFAGSELLATWIGIICSIVLFLIVWRGAWGQRDAIVGLAIVLGGVLSSYIDQYSSTVHTEFIFLRLGASGRMETSLALVATVAGTIVLAISAARGRLPRDRIRPVIPRRGTRG